jgi:hypothetical protein
MDLLVADICGSDISILVSSSSRAYYGSQYKYNNENKLNKLFDRVVDLIVHPHGNHDQPTGSNSSLLYTTLSQSLLSDPRLLQQKKLNALIDKFPTMLHLAAQTQSGGEMISLKQLLDIILSNINENISASVTRILPKVYAILCRHCSQRDNSKWNWNYAKTSMEMLSALMNCSQRNLLLPSIVELRNVLFPLLSNPDHQDLSGRVLAETLTFDTVETWLTTWKETTNNTLCLIGHLGIPVKSQSLGNMSSHLSVSSYGLEKAVSIERMFRGQIVLLAKVNANLNKFKSKPLTFIHFLDVRVWLRIWISQY